VFWQVGSSASIGTTAFVANIIAFTSITSNPCCSHLRSAARPLAATAP
jgi:hypothetical protein